MYGGRGRLGLIVPSSNTTNESEVYSHLPSGVSLHTSRMHLKDAETGELEAMTDDVKRCSRLLATANVDVIMYGCTTGSLVKGPGYETEIEERLEAGTGIPSVATAASIKRGFNALGIERLAIATPYERELNEREETFLENAGYEVLDISGLNIRRNTEIGAQRPEIAYQQALAAFDEAQESADGIFLSCTNYRTFEIIERLEELQRRGETRWSQDGYVILDDTINQKAGDEVPSVGRFYDHAEGNTVWSQNIVYAFYK